MIEPFIDLQDFDFSRPNPLFNLWREYGFSLPSAHVTPWLLKEEEKIGETLLALHRHTGISTFIFSGLTETEGDGRRCGSILGKAAREIREEGISILYHNHTMEFEPVPHSDQTILDVIFEAAEDAVGLQLDIGWAGIVGDEIAIARRYADRVVEIHCKDFYPGARQYTWNNMPKEFFAPIGEGWIQTKAILDMIPSFRHFNGVVLIDQDQSAGNMLEDIRVGYQNLLSIVKG
ncbi:MAG: sugar phosphate isomerase/epimerase [Clostridia bacterium]|nr:sugar phosphate isomerase/epimerase [Clostridia bacterium]